MRDCEFDVTGLMTGCCSNYVRLREICLVFYVADILHVNKYVEMCRYEQKLFLKI